MFTEAASHSWSRRQPKHPFLLPPFSNDGSLHFLAVNLREVSDHTSSCTEAVLQRRLMCDDVGRSQRPRDDV